MRNSILHVVCVSCLFMAMGCTTKSHPEWSDARVAMEEDAALRLEEARKAVDDGNFDLAKRILKDIREKDSLAISARKAGILLMDSVNFLEAEHEMQRIGKEMLSSSHGIDSLQSLWEEAQRKARFYQRKLEHDKQHRHAQ